MGVRGSSPRAIHLVRARLTLPQGDSVSGITLAPLCDGHMKREKHMCFSGPTCAEKLVLGLMHMHAHMWDGKLVLGLTNTRVYVHAHTWDGKLVLGLARTHMHTHTWDGKLVLDLTNMHARTCTHTRGMGSWCWASRTCTHTHETGSWCWASHARTCTHTHVGWEAGAGPH